MRWNVVVTYKDESGIPFIDFDVEELEELQDIIEGGPDFNEIEEINITYNHGE